MWRNRDLGVHIHRSLKVVTQVDRAVKKAYSVLTFINRGFEFKSCAGYAATVQDLGETTLGILCAVLVTSL